MLCDGLAATILGARVPSLAAVTPKQVQSESVSYTVVRQYAPAVLIQKHGIIFIVHTHALVKPWARKPTL